MKPGDVIASRFVIERLASAGGMGVVYRARDRDTDRLVAVKVLHHPTVAVNRFAREAEVLAKLDHPHIVKYVAHGTDAAGAPWLAIEWLDGHDLASRLLRGRLGVEEAVSLARRVADALGAAHAHGIVHRDIKPSNLFLEDGELARVKVLDFGVARLANTTSARTRTGTTLGTPAYMAPEQARGEHDVDARVDVFALGCVLFESIAGRPVFVAEHVMAILAKVLLEEAPRLKEIEPSVPPPLDELVAPMLSKTPEQRPADGRAVVVELERATRGTLDDTHDQPAPPSLTAGEQRLLSVVLAQSRADRARAAGEQGPPPSEDPAAAALAETLQPVDESGTVLKVRVELASFGARVEKLAEGSLVATLPGAGGTATDQAARAARFALALRDLLPDTPMALATGRGSVVT
ncbi:MAG TPA: serine/threonine-protein kinase, partial [Minicystis sp.]|nr:serine/threonine-protein kinase [Minicystis sp.]